MTDDEVRDLAVAVLDQLERNPPDDPTGGWLIVKGASLAWALADYGRAVQVGGDRFCFIVWKEGKGRDNPLRYLYPDDDTGEVIGRWINPPADWAESAPEYDWFGDAEEDPPR